MRHDLPALSAREGRHKSATLVAWCTAAGRTQPAQSKGRPRACHACLRRRSQSKHDHPLSLEPLGHEKVPAEWDQDEGDSTCQHCQQQPVGEAADLALVQGQHKRDKGASPCKRVVGREEQLWPTRVQGCQLVDPSLPLEQQVIRWRHIQKQWQAHSQCEALAESAGYPTVDDEDRVDDCSQCGTREQGVKRLEPHRVLRQDSQALVRQEEVKSGGVHKSSGL
mmetsp:Transcript_106973/g.276697  ORF Transcript_106973/g.276697 Transcript_106973/m.276697 type:complete len:223 (+) Transcript_106973:40-708(+)